MKTKNILLWALVPSLVALVLTLLNPNSHLRGGSGGGWDWYKGDYLFSWAFFVVLGFTLRFVVGKMKTKRSRIWAGAAVAAGFAAIWGALATG